MDQNSGINSELSKAFEVAFNVTEKVDYFTVSNNHLGDANGGWSKFSTNSKAEVNSLIKEGLQSENAVFSPNNVDSSYRITTDLGRVIGTNGETKIFTVIGGHGKIWTSYPVK